MALALWTANTYGAMVVVRSGGALFALIGFGCLAYAWLAANRARASLEWRPAQARILRSHVAVQQDSMARSEYNRSPTRTPVTYYSPDVEYEYGVQGTTYRSNSVFVVNASRGKTDAEATVARYPAGGCATAWVDPRNPNRAVLERGVEANRSAYMTAAIVGAVFTAVGLAIWFIVPVLFR